jgi:hypothetical protein
MEGGLSERVYDRSYRRGGACKRGCACRVEFIYPTPRMLPEFNNEICIDTVVRKYGINVDMNA